ncbi:hypothetical protein VCB98_00630 [Gammaproteobacteria bacterium AB-CW1]|uniref:Lipoprotein n=1 Tax=Natronospira elongata TaxID=3110268 RepID=A0AAP6JD40_9GAMM|nr:hypothetical protein [Gammaproteobacteria bacterium AB-CW1]
MNRRCLSYPTIMLLALLLAACQALPSREEMLTHACEANPCRQAHEIELIDGEGRIQRFQVPAGPLFAGGVVSVMSGERAGLNLSESSDGRLSLQWVAPEKTSEADLVLELNQVKVEGGHASELRVQNRMDKALQLDLEQFPASEERFFPLAAPPIPPESRVRRHWPHTILEIQLTGARRAGENPGREP